jgi:hypothetical protein
MTESTKEYSYGKSGFVMSEDEITNIAEKIGGGLCLMTIERLIKTKKNSIGVMGVLITASNNSYTDNGVKIINNNGDNISNEDYDIDTISILDKYVNDKYDIDEIHKILSDHKEKLKPKSTINSNSTIKSESTINLTTLIGNDTRRSSEIIKSKIIKGFAHIVHVFNSLHISQMVSLRLSCDFIDYDLATEPEFRVLVQKYNETYVDHNDNNHKDVDHKDVDHNDNDHKDIDYIDAYAQEISSIITNKFIDFSDFIVDCAYGIGSCSMNKIFKMYVNNSKIEPMIINDKIYDYHKLCNNCGTDYVMRNHKQLHNNLIKFLYEDDDNENDGLNLNFNMFCPDTLYASLNDNAERIIFYYYDRYRFNILSGDHISYLILKYIITIMDESCQEINQRLLPVDQRLLLVDQDYVIKICVMHTKMSDNVFVESVDKIIKGCKNISIERIVFEDINKSKLKSTSNLSQDDIITKSKKYVQSKIYDVCVCYSIDGFGTTIISDDFSKSRISVPMPNLIQSELLVLKTLFNQYTSDAIMTLIGFAYIMNMSKITYDQLSLFL